METRYFYTSPVDHHNLETWDALARRLEKRVLERCSGISVDVGDKPVFGYGVDSEGALASVSALKFSSRNLHIDLWSSIVSYAVISLTFGSAITERERRAVTEHLAQRELEDQALLRTLEGPYDEDSIQVYGYAFSGADDEDDDIEFLLDPFDGPIYIGPRDFITSDRGSIDDQSFELLSEANGAAMFVANDPDAAKSLWRRAFDTSNDGLIAFYGGDPAEGALLQRFSELDDPRILLNEHPSAGMRVTIGRCHPDDLLVVVYTPGEPPDLEPSFLFAI